MQFEVILNFVDSHNFHTDGTRISNREVIAVTMAGEMSSEASGGLGLFRLERAQRALNNLLP